MFQKIYYNTVNITLITILILTGISLGVRAQEPEQEDTIQLSGSGQEATERFSLESGLAIFKMTHSGQANFIVTLLDSNGERVGSLVNEIGPFDGSKAEKIPAAGEYILDVTASGPWTIDIKQPQPDTAPSIPQSLTGHGQQASQMFSAGSGLATFKMTHDGSANFIVTLLDSNGERIGSLVNEIGPFDGSKATRIPKGGIYILDIAADGNWTIDIEGEEYTEKEAQAENEKTSNNTTSSSETEGCFIATAAYGTELAPEIDILRDFRDQFLLENHMGSKFVNLYYDKSPQMADYIAERPVLKSLVKNAGVEPLVKIVESSRIIWEK